MTEALCPLEDRRNVNEMTSKLILAHVIAIFTGYWQLLHMRGEKVISIKLFWFIIHPYIVVAQYIFALSLLAIYFVFGSVIATSEENMEFLSRASCLLFGKLEIRNDLQNQRSSGSRDNEVIQRRGQQQSSLRGNGWLQRRGQQQSSSRGNGGLPRWRQQQSGSRGNGWLGRVTKTFGFALMATQCIGTTLMYSRRNEHNAVAQIDTRLLHLALGTLVVSLLGMIYQLFEPRAYRPDPDCYNTRRELSLVCLLGLHLHYGGSNNDLHRLYSGLLGGVLAFYMLLPSRLVFTLMDSPARYTSLLFTSSSPESVDIIALVDFMMLFHAVYMSAFLPVLSVFRLKYATFREMLPWWLNHTWWRSGRHWRLKYLIIRILHLLMYIMTVAVLTIPFLLYLAPVDTLIALVPTWKKLTSELQAMKEWPEDQPCPLLWQDPKSSILWGLV